MVIVLDSFHYLQHFVVVVVDRGEANQHWMKPSGELLNKTKQKKTLYLHVLGHEGQSVILAKGFIGFQSLKAASQRRGRCVH